MKTGKMSAALLASLLLASLAGCAGGGEPVSAQSASGTSSAAPASSAPASQSQSQPQSQSEEPPLEASFMLPIWEPVPDMNDGWWSRFSEETNTKFSIEWVPAADIATKFDLVLSSGSLPDVFWGEDISRPTLVTAIKQGAFWDLTPVLGDFSNYPNLRGNMTPGVMDYPKVDGKYYAIPRNRPQIDQGIKIRQDWLEKLGMEMPKDLDEFYAYIKGCVDEKLGGADTVGVPTLWGLENVIVNGFGANEIERDSDGGLVYYKLNRGYTDSVEYFRRLYQDGLMPREYFTLTYSDYQGMFTTGRAATFTENIWRDYDMQTKIRTVQPEGAVETIVDMKGPAGWCAKIEKGFYGAFYISKSVDEAKMLRLMDYFELTCSEYWLEKGYYGWEGVHFNYSADGNREMTDLGKKEVTATGVQQPLPMMKNTWAKVVMPSAPKAYNDAKLARVEPILELAKINPFEIVISDTWTKFWGKNSAEFDQKRTQCITGQISVEDYRAYIDGLKNTADAKTAFQEFKDSYAEKFGQS